jgi:hypothetical protein
MDCFQVFQDLKSIELRTTEYGEIIEACKELLSLNRNFRVSFVKCQANRVAHELSRASRS